MVGTSASVTTKVLAVVAVCPPSAFVRVCDTARVSLNSQDHRGVHSRRRPRCSLRRESTSSQVVSGESTVVSGNMQTHDQFHCQPTSTSWSNMRSRVPCRTFPRSVDDEGQLPRSAPARRGRHDLPRQYWEDFARCCCRRRGAPDLKKSCQSEAMREDCTTGGLYPAPE